MNENDGVRFGIDTDSLINLIKSGVTSPAEVGEICSKLHTSTEGLPSFPAHLNLRQASFGRNDLITSPPPHFLSYSAFLYNSYSQLQFTFIRNILLIIIFLSLAHFALILVIKDEADEFWFLGFFDFLEVLLLLVIPIWLDASRDYKRQNGISETFQRLGASGANCEVMRNGQFQTLKFKDIVVGDVIELKEGDVVPADGLLLENNTEIVFYRGKLVTKNIGLCCTMGSVISKGEGIMVATCVGPNAQLSLLANEPPQPKEVVWAPLLLRLAVFLGVLTTSFMITRFSINTYLINQSQFYAKHLQFFSSCVGHGFSNFIAVIPLTLPFVSVWTFHHNPDKTKARVAISKFLQFRVTINIVLVLLDIVQMHFESSTSLSKNVQKAWIHLLSNLLGIAIFPSDVTKEVIKDGNVMPSQTVKNIFGQIFFQFSIVVVLKFYSEGLIDIPLEPFNEPNTHSTLIFNTLVFMTLFHVICVRGSRGSGRNFFSGILRHKKFCFLWILITIIQICIVQLGGLTFFTYPLRISEWLYTLCLALGVFLWMQVLFCVCCCTSTADQSSRAVDYVPDESSV